VVNPQTVNERRSDRRVSTSRRGVIKFGPAGQELACTVEDLTATGAGLHVATTFGLPRVFQLTIDDVGSKHCRVVWSDGKRIGVSFE
jgi:PilZ domain-containing protein